MGGRYLDCLGGCDRQITQVILTSTDGANWVQRKSGTRYPLDGINYGNGQFVAVGIRSPPVTSPTG